MLSESSHEPAQIQAARPRVLLVDASRVMQLRLGKQLIRRGYEVVTCQSVPEALGLIASASLNLLLVDMELPDISGLDFLLWLKAHRPELPAILMLSHLGTEMGRFLRQQDLLYFDKSWQIETLLSLLEPLIRKRGLDITVQELTLFELLQLCVVSGRQRCLQLTEPVTGQQGTIWFAKNQIVHALMNGSEGETALLQMMRLKKGTFHEITWERVDKESVHKPFDSLMMGIATRLDEEAAAGGPQPSDHGEHRLQIVSWNAQQRLMLEQHFVGLGYSVKAMGRAAEALAWLGEQPVDLLICDLDPGDTSLPAFFEQVHALRPQTRVLLLVDELSLQMAQLARQWGAAACVQKPIVLGEFEAMVRYIFSPNSFSGKLWNMSLIDFLQVVSFSNRSKTYRILDLGLEAQGMLYFEQGSLVHAELEQLRGEAAFQAMLAIERGLLSEGPPGPAPVRSIELPLTRLMMRALSSLDLPLQQAESLSQPLPFSVSEALPGRSLRELIEGERLSLGDSLTMLAQLAMTLDQAHHQGHIYRDLRPEAVRILPNRLISISEAEGQLSENGTGRGSITYFSPEQLFHPEQASPQSDIFSFGVIMYELLTRELPFYANDSSSAILSVMGEEPRAPRELNPRLPEALELIMLRCLEKEPINRFESARDLADSLMACLQQPLDLQSDIRPDRSQRPGFSPLQAILRSTTSLKLRSTLMLSGGQRLKLLYVEDDPIRQKMLPDFINEVGLNYDCILTGSVAEALQLVSRQDFDFIICDYILKDGTADALIELAQGTPLVVVSSLNQPEVIIRLMKKGALDYIIKTTAQDEFTRVMELIQKQTAQLRQITKLDTLPGLAVSAELSALIASQGLQAASAGVAVATPAAVAVPAPLPAPVVISGPPEIVFQKVIGGPGNGPGQFASPRWVHYCPYRNNILVADTQNSRIQILSLAGEVIRIVKHPELQAPCAVNRAADGRLFVLDAADARLRIFSPEGSLLQTTGGRPGMMSAFGLALLDPAQAVITDPEGGSLHFYDAAGTLQTSLSQPYKSPSGLAQANGQLFVLDFALPAVFRLDAQGRQLGRFGKRGTGKGDFSVPKGISVSEHGLIFISEALSHRVQVFDSEGRWLTSFGKKGGSVGEFVNPESLACRPGGVVYVLDRGNHRIQVFKYLSS